MATREEQERREEEKEMLRAPIAFHLFRIIEGLWVVAAGDLLPTHLPGSWAASDIVLAGTALIALTLAGDGHPGSRRWIRMWSVAGLIQILLVSGAVLDAAATNPSGILPMLLLPFLAASHLMILARLRTRTAAAGLQRPPRTAGPNQVISVTVMR